MTGHSMTAHQEGYIAGEKAGRLACRDEIERLKERLEIIEQKRVENWDRAITAEAERDAANERAEGYGRAYSRELSQCDSDTAALKAQLETAKKALEEVLCFIDPDRSPPRKSNREMVDQINSILRSLQPSGDPDEDLPTAADVRGILKPDEDK